LEPAAIDALHAAIPGVLTEAIAEIRRRDEPVDVKVSDFLKWRAREGKPCLVCGTTIRAVRVGDGDACFCPTCQPETRKLFINWTAGPSKGPAPPAMGPAGQSPSVPDAIGAAASADGGDEKSKERRTAFS